MEGEQTEPDLRTKPATVTLDIADDVDSLRLWWCWDDLSPEVRKALADIAEDESRLNLDDESSISIANACA